MINAFDADVACDVGINAAILYRNIQYWCEKNRTNGKNEFDGYFWTYNSIAAFTEQFPYLTKRQIELALKTLEDKNYIKSGNFNKAAYDRTKWYTDARLGNVKCISRTGEMDSTYTGNPFCAGVEPIPDDYTNNNQMTIKDSKKVSFDDILDSFPVIANNSELRDIFVEFIKMRKRIKAPLTERALKLNINEALKLSNGDVDLMKQIVEQSVRNSYRGVFPVKNKNQQDRRNDGNEFTEYMKEQGWI